MLGIDCNEGREEVREEVPQATPMVYSTPMVYCCISAVDMAEMGRSEKVAQVLGVL